MIQYGSFRHWIYYLAASKNISSQKMGKPNAAICYVLEVYGILRNKRAFLQHGIITADLSFLYYPHTKMSLFVTSTYDEWKYVMTGTDIRKAMCRSWDCVVLTSFMI